ncbi:MAG: cytochrome b/b6 domain-containing protein [Deltaproteobacteria bacterium]|nr:cytochrome b/b6 domain-containing protein [Deltaproteobacteria bacterium]
MERQRYNLVTAWDPVLRFLHWWNVLFMSVQVATGAIFMLSGDGLGKGLEARLVFIHAASGFFFGAGLFGRILWLFVGPPSASWRDILPLTPVQWRSIGETIRFYLRGFKGALSPSLSHNAFAGPVYAAFFIIAAVQVASGSVLLGLPDKLRAKSFSLELHETGFALILAYAGAHVLAVFIHELIERHAIVAAMIHGRKTFTEAQTDELVERYANLNDGGIDERKD